MIPIGALAPQYIAVPTTLMSPISPLFSCLLFVFEFMILDPETEKDLKAARLSKRWTLVHPSARILPYELDCHQL